MASKANNAVQATLVTEPGLLRVQGEMTFATVAALNDEAHAVLASANGAMTIDLAAVSRADSAGVALIIEWQRLAQAAGCRVSFSNIPAQVGRLIEVSGLDGAVRE